MLKHHLPTGKLPPELLTRLLGKIPRLDKRVLVGGCYGEDAAVIEFGGSCLIAASDPITFAADRPAWYAVQVNANDIAAMGGECRWLLATVLLPEGRTDESMVEALFTELSAACGKIGVEIVGGHTEISVGLERPIICGTMLGEASPGRLCLKRNARQGDHLLLTKAIAVEGTALIAREFPDKLTKCCTEAEILQSAKLLETPGISVLAEARIALDTGGVHAMHDPTESGLAGAVRELAEAAGLGVELELDQVPVYESTRKICDQLGLDPLGLIASGSLLIASEPEASDSIIRAVEAEGISCKKIGMLTGRETGLVETRSGETKKLRRFERDEIVRLFD